MTAAAKPGRKGRRRAASMPRETRFEADRVGVRRAEPRVTVKRAFKDVSDWFAELDRLALDPFMPEGRQQPLTPQQIVRRPDR
jgi:virulence-associated protein VagC